MQVKFRSAFVAFLIVSAVSMSAVASASAHEFEASKTGKLTDTIKLPVTFHLPGASVNAECAAGAEVTGTGSVTELKRKTLTTTVTYKKCEFVTGIRPFTAEWEVSAEGTTKLVKAFTIEVPVLLCKWKVVPTAGEESTVGFTNSKPVATVAAVRASKHMKFERLEGKEENCGKTNEASTWNESFTLGVEGGTLLWK